MKNKKKLQPSFAVYNFPYFSKNHSFLTPLIAKGLFAAFAAGAGAYYFTHMLLLPNWTWGAAFTAGFACIAYFVLLNAFREMYVNIFTLASLGIYFLFWRKEIFSDAVDFVYYVLKTCNGKIVNTTQFISQHPKADPVPFLFFLTVMFGVICGYSYFRRCRFEAVSAFFGVMVVPAFLSLRAAYHPSLALFIASNFALKTMSSSMTLSTYLTAGGNINTYALDKDYAYSTRKLKPSDKIKSGSENYGRHISEGLLTAVSVVLIMGIAASVFPKDGSIKLENLINKAVEIINEVGENGLGIFTVSSSEKASFTGYFSAEGNKRDINISGSITPHSNPKNDQPVVEVITENRDKLYIKGDIGYKFDGKSWESIAGINYWNKYYTDYVTNDGPESIDTIFNNYIPELQFLNARYALNRYGDFIGSQAVKINYLSKMNTVLFPGTPFIYNFRENNNFSVKGDFVALADKGKINSMETAVFYPISSALVPSTSYGLDYFDLEIDENTLISSYGMTEELLIHYINCYQSYVYNNYTDVPKSEASTMEGFLEDMFGISDTVRLNEIYSRSELAYNICRYLSSDGVYKYSIITNNFGREKSAIDTFLNDTKSGHCAMYASSMCLALRYLGIPARYVTGFTVGEGRECQYAGNEIRYKLAPKDLHAWVEVYYDNIGWLPYDPTPSVYMNYIAPTEVTTEAVTTAVSEITTTITTAPQGEVTTANTTKNEITQNSNSEANTSSPDSEKEKEIDYTAVKVILIVLGALAVLFVIAMAIRGGLKSLREKEKKLFKFFKNGNGTKAVERMLSLTLTLLKIKGINRKKGETPEEFGIRADEKLKLNGLLTEAIPLFEREEFDESPEFTEQEQKELYAFVKRLTKTVLGEMKKPKLLITRIKLFGKGK